MTRQACGRVRLATYQSMSGAGDAGVERLRAVEPMGADLSMDWDLVGDEFDEELKLREETRKILGLPDLPIQATCVRTPVLVGHGQAIWVETEEPLSPEQAGSILEAAPHVTLEDFPDSRLGGRAGRGARRTDSPRVERGRARALGCERQPPQGRRPERDADRGADSGSRARFRLVAVDACVRVVE